MRKALQFLRAFVKALLIRLPLLIISWVASLMIAITMYLSSYAYGNEYIDLKTAIQISYNQNYCFIKELTE